MVLGKVWVEGKAHQPLFIFGKNGYGGNEADRLRNRVKLLYSTVPFNDIRGTVFQYLKHHRLIQRTFGRQHHGCKPIVFGFLRFVPYEGQKHNTCRQQQYTYQVKGNSESPH